MRQGLYMCVKGMEFGRTKLHDLRLTCLLVLMQTVQYIQPQHHAQLAQAELVVIDEAAAIPLPLVKAMLGPYLVFLCSTVNGYEGTGRSLSLKLITQLRAEVSVEAGLLLHPLEWLPIGLTCFKWFLDIKV